MFPNWSSPARRALALGLALIAALMMFDYIIAPIIGVFTAQSERVAELEAQYERFAVAASRQADAQERLDRLKTDTVWREPLIDASSLRDAAAVLQRQVRVLAEEADTTTLSFQPVDRQADYGFAMPGVRFELEATNEQLADFARGLNEVSYRLVLDAVTIRHRGAARGSTGQQVRVRGDVFAFWAPPGADQ